MGCRLINLFIPGAGLILRRREWVGFLLALLFGLATNAAIAGYLIAPEAIPFWLSTVATVIAVLTWVLSQVLLQRQDTLLTQQFEALASLLELSRSAMDRGDFESAGQSLSNAMEIDDEHVEANVLLARYCVHIGDREQARKVWHRVRKLDQSREFDAEAAIALNENQ